MTIRAIIIDDSFEKVKKITNVLEKMGVRPDKIDVANNAHDARNNLRSRSYDLAIIDLALPSFENDANVSTLAGLSLLKEINERSTTYIYPKNIIAISAFEELSDGQKNQFESLFVKILHYSSSNDAWQSEFQNFTLNVIRASEDSKKIQYGVDICIFAALPAELAPFLQLPLSFGSEQPLDDVGHYWEGILEKDGRKLTVIATHAPRMGMVPTAVMSSRIISKFRPKVMVMPGICGGMSGSSRLGDAILASPTWDWQSGKIILNGDKVEFEGDPHQILVPETIVSKFNSMIRNVAIWEGIRERWKKNAPHDIPVGRVGPVASGAAVLADGITAKDIKSSQQRKLTAIDMEIYGFYASAHYFSSPQPKTFAIKAVSDLADADKGDDWQPYAFHVSAWATYHFLNEYLYEYIENIANN